MNQQQLRTQVRILKAIEGIKYKNIAEDLLDMQAGSFYNFLCQKATLSEERAQLLKDFINDAIN